jgi:hypothetical protein
VGTSFALGKLAICKASDAAKAKEVALGPMLGQGSWPQSRNAKGVGRWGGQVLGGARVRDLISAVDRFAAKLTTTVRFWHLFSLMSELGVYNPWCRHQSDSRLAFDGHYGLTIPGSQHKPGHMSPRSPQPLCRGLRRRKFCSRARFPRP